MDESGFQITATPDMSCCLISRAPLPEFQCEASDFSLELVANKVSDHVGDIPRVRGVSPVAVVQDFSPPSLQSILCTFLI